MAVNNLMEYSPFIALDTRGWPRIFAVSVNPLSILYDTATHPYQITPMNFNCSLICIFIFIFIFGEALIATILTNILIYPEHTWMVFSESA
jgi:hypothetical protein